MASVESIYKIIIVQSSQVLEIALKGLLMFTTIKIHTLTSVSYTHLDVYKRQEVYSKLVEELISPDEQNRRSETDLP